MQCGLQDAIYGLEIMKINENDWAILDNGTELLSVCYSGLSLTKDGCLASGCDDQLYLCGKWALTPEQRGEIARYMVVEWTKWGNL